MTAPHHPFGAGHTPPPRSALSELSPDAVVLIHGNGIDRRAAVLSLIPFRNVYAHYEKP